MESPHKMDTIGDGEAYDVIIIGSGFGGGTLATILARHGFSVLMLEAGRHPRFAIGESVVPDFGARAKLMALCFDVPELAWMGNFHKLRDKISPASGIKRNFTFLYHRKDRVHLADECCQFETLTSPLGPDSHIWRADLDEWLTKLAVQYGADYRDLSRAIEFEADGAGATVTVENGRKYRAKFVVDAAGRRSVLTEKFDLKREPRMRTDSRSIFTHMTGVHGIDEARIGLPPLPIPSPPDQGTCHHLFDGGWFWVIPFNNHREATNPVVSIGLTLDRRKFPDNDLSAEEEFHEIASRFPTVARLVEGARPVRDWVKTGRIQYECERMVGERWCMLPHAAGFIDPLFSGGMTLTLVGVQEVARTLIASLEADDFETARFEPIEAGARESMDSLDKVIHGAYIAFQSYDLFNAWYRFWSVGNYHSALGLVRLHMKYLSTGNREVLDQVYEAPYRRLLATDQPRVRELFEAGYEVLENFDARLISPRGATDALYDLLEKADWIPPDFHIAERERKHLASFTVPSLSRTIFWGKINAPEDLQETCYDIGPAFYRELLRSLSGEGARGLGPLVRAVWGAHSSRARL